MTNETVRGAVYWSVYLALNDAMNVDVYWAARVAVTDAVNRVVNRVVLDAVHMAFLEEIR